MKSMLRSSKLASGLIIKFYKSKIGGVGIQGAKIDTYANAFNCSQMTNPFLLT